MRSYRGFLRHVIARAPEPVAESIEATAASGRLLLREVRARVDDPAEARSAMDGFAVRVRDLHAATTECPVELRVRGLSPAGCTRATRLAAGTAHRIMTGAPVPSGADGVVPIEQAEALGDRVKFFAASTRGQHIRRPRENFRRGQLLIRAGTELRPQEVGLAITAGMVNLRVARRPRVGVLATGEELVPPGRRLRRGEVYDSNRPTILAMITDLGMTPVDLGTVGDRPHVLRRRLTRWQESLDFLITIGGVSAGDFDVVKLLVREYPGVELVRVAIKPAKPQAFGRVGRLFWYGLPGNPVSAMVAFDRFVRPLLLRSMGAHAIFRRPRVGICGRQLTKRHRLREFVRARAEHRSGAWHVRPVGPTGSSNLRSMVNANAFIILPEECTRVCAGGEVSFELFRDPPESATP